MPPPLPSNWVETTLGEIRRDSSSGISRAEMRGETFEIYSVPAFAAGRPETVKGDDVGSNKVFVSAGDVLLCKINPRINRAWIVGGDDKYRKIASTEWIVFSKQEGITPEFLRYFFTQESFREHLAANVSGVGGSLMRVPARVVEQVKFPLPPVAEQARIVAQLDAAFEKISAGEAAAHRARAQLAPFRAAILRAAVAGELSADWRSADNNQALANGRELIEKLVNERRTQWEEAELHRRAQKKIRSAGDAWKQQYALPSPTRLEGLPALPSGWAWARLEQVSFVIGGLTKNPRREKLPLKVPYLRVANVYSNELRLDDVASIGVDKDELGKLRVEKGDLLVVEGNGSKDQIGRVAIWDGSIEPCVHQNHLIKVRLADKALGKWILFWLLSPLGREYIENVAATTTGLYTLSITKVGDLPIPLPPLDEQRHILEQVELQLAASKRLETAIDRQLDHSKATRQALLSEAFGGRLAPQDPADESPSTILDQIRLSRTRAEAAHAATPKRKAGSRSGNQKEIMKHLPPSIGDLGAAFERIDRQIDAIKLFREAGFGPEEVESFYNSLRKNKTVYDVFSAATAAKQPAAKKAPVTQQEVEKAHGRFRLVELSLTEFKNLKDYRVNFEPTHGLDVVLGWNGTGKSNLFEALIIIFRDLFGWWERDQWRPDPRLAGYRLRYEIDQREVEVTWDDARMQRPVVRLAVVRSKPTDEPEWKPAKREALPLPRFVFGYYSGPTNRLAENFLPMKQAHYERLRKADSDDKETLLWLLAQRRFFCAETHHAKYVLLAFFYKKDPEISRFLEERLRIVGFESALFVIREPRWKRNNNPEDFWGATGIMRRVMECLRRYAIAPMVLEQSVSDGYRTATENHYYFFLPNLESLHAFAAEYADAQSFFVALESTDFSELIHDVKIQVRVKATKSDEIPITFRELSEGEQQLLMVLGLLRFTKSHQSLVLLDEPDTHLNPHWSVDYLKLLTRVMADRGGNSDEQQSSQILISTHDPLVIASLVRQQVHLLKRNPDTLKCYWEPASEDPKGLGFTGILLSDMFGFNSDLDPETRALLDQQAELSAKAGHLSATERSNLEKVNTQVAQLGFKSTSSDPYYRAFIEALGRNRETMALLQKPTVTPEEKERVRKQADSILAGLAKKHGLAP